MVLKQEKAADKDKVCLGARQVMVRKENARAHRQTDCDLDI